MTYSISFEGWEKQAPIILRGWGQVSFQGFSCRRAVVGKLRVPSRKSSAVLSHLLVYSSKTDGSEKAKHVAILVSSAMSHVTQTKLAEVHTTAAGQRHSVV